ncbi:MAG TPA: hypothetical protein VG013_35550 [Gemmataceae bacterium]|jgi:hypothetical protein|nr:hypothetical protein [Gemmataceae bacterium]
MRCLPRSLVVLLLLACSAPLLAAPPAVKKKARPAASQFLRIRRDAKGQPVALETAIVRYVPASGEGDLEVDLVAAVHIGDAAYYDRLNKQFEHYDVLLYELVAPEGKRVPRRDRPSDNPIAILQQIAKTVLDLDWQIDRIDYRKKNFVHADLSPKEMAEAIRMRGDDGVTLALSITADLLRQYNLQEMKKEKNPPKDEDVDLDLASLLLDPDAPVKLKRVMAQQFEAVAGGTGLGKTLDTILVRDRNKAAMKVFQKQLARGKKKVAIFYGAAHMPDFEKRLREDFGLKPKSRQWLTAWDLQAKEHGLEDLLKLFDP